MYRKQLEQGEGHLTEPEWAAKTVLSNLGFRVEEVPRSSQKTPDFIVDGDTPGYVVEVASRFLSETLLEEGSLTLDQTWDAKVAEWLAEACKQSRTVDPDHERLWFVWGTAEGPTGFDSQVLMQDGVRMCLQTEGADQS